MFQNSVKDFRNAIGSLPGSVCDLARVLVLAVKVDLESTFGITKDEAALSTVLHMSPKLTCENRCDTIFQVVAEETNCSSTRHG